ncbi:hypothetical protein T552_01033 [Pneumocystis carinii B80]|uniref:NADH dehydrogenase [ubiquinone] 1 alpha subcomplex subunit 13 n=1 Tax=Pneumocystis carinii (strain B80) TaxID=1408658 RepID=A0A0W4ZN72_PNEC8|nr:hypothetical protein T552_01033 [Pneumocystis carinii B80]KTW29829.1 hypothetical protein T552_01033 [Pneumocystis carinii B80]
MTKPSQDLPPTGGYAPIQYKRNLPAKGPRSSVVLLCIGLISSYGFYRYIQGVYERRELKRENVWSRIHLIPLLQVEAERDMYRRRRELLQLENEVMKGVEGWDNEYRIYHTRADIVPTYSFPLE